MFTIRSRFRQQAVAHLEKKYHRRVYKISMSSKRPNLPRLKVEADANKSTTPHHAGAGPLSRFEMNGYRPSPILSEDENYMDIVMIITRSSLLRQGSMGCILVQPASDADEASTDDESGCSNNQFFGRIISAAINTSLFKPDSSDVHAEINAIGQVAKRTRSSSSALSVTTKGATAYITMPPCTRCFGALYACGIKRVVSRRGYPDVITKAASNVGIELYSFTQREFDDQKVRMDDFFANVDTNSGGEHHGNADELILKRRMERKVEKQARKMAKIEKLNDEGSNGSGGDKISG